MPDVPELSELLTRFGIALAIGLLIGIEREREKPGTFAGIRTIPLITLLGCASALISDEFAPYMFPAAFAILAAFVLRSYILMGTTASPGITTEVASLLSYVLGGLVWWGLTAFAAAMAVVIVLLLAAKEPLHRLSNHVGHHDIIAAMQFGVLTLVILPILPDRTFGPLDVLNPHTIWMMVIFIAGVNLVGYALVKMLGSNQGITLAGLLGGIASSTALTVGFARRSRGEGNLARPFALAILIASTIMFARVLVIVASISAPLGRILLAPMAGIMAVGVLLCFGFWYALRRQSDYKTESGSVPVSNPLEIWTALQFGLLFGLILFVSKAAQTFTGSSGILLSSSIAGLADMDAIALSLASLVDSGSVPAETAAKGVILAALTNTAMKASLVAVIGIPSLRRYLVPAFGMLIIAGLITIIAFMRL